MTEADPTTYERVHVSPSDLGSVEYHGSLWTVTGTSEDGEELITFAGEPRYMNEFLAAIVATDETQVAQVADYQIRRAQRAILDCGCPVRLVEDTGHQEGCEAWVYE